MAGVAKYVATDMVTAYTNNIKAHYSDYLHHAVNVLLQTKQCSADIARDMEGSSAQEIRAARELQVWGPARALKRATKLRVPTRDGLNDQCLWALTQLQPVVMAYDASYTFPEQGRFYDVQVHPERHFLSLYRLCEFFEYCRDQTLWCIAFCIVLVLRVAVVIGLVIADSALLDVTAAEAAMFGLAVLFPQPQLQTARHHNNHHQHQCLCKPKTYQSCPLRKAFVPCHMLISTAILRSQILRSHNVAGVSDVDLWDVVLNTRSRPFTQRHDLAFDGSVTTDGVSIGIILKDKEAQKRHQQALIASKHASYG
ncbi:hypothetical protein GGI24_001494 [Coemansia furcata]|nr:hypothetical protein GGI24_001494 [Coemansia furcata]